MLVLQEVREHGRGTRPAAPVEKVPAAHVHKKGDVQETMDKDEVERRREGTSVCPGRRNPANSRGRQRRNRQRRESGPKTGSAGGAPQLEEAPRRGERRPNGQRRTKGTPERGVPGGNPRGGGTRLFDPEVEVEGTSTSVLVALTRPEA